MICPCGTIGVQHDPKPENQQERLMVDQQLSSVTSQSIKQKQERQMSRGVVNEYAKMNLNSNLYNKNNNQAIQSQENKFNS